MNGLKESRERLTDENLNYFYDDPVELMEFAAIKPLGEGRQLLEGQTAKFDELQQVKLGWDQTPLIFFTTKGATVTLHYCEESAISGLVMCNGEKCVLCSAGKKVGKRLILPVFNPAREVVEALLVSPSSRPGSLLPQLKSALGSLVSSQYQLVMIAKSGWDFSVTPYPNSGNKFADHPIINKFNNDLRSGRVSLTSVIKKIDNDALALIPEISRILELVDGNHVGD